VKAPHTGTQRISTLKMYPMSLYESGESNGEVSLQSLFDAPEQFAEAAGLGQLTIVRPEQN